MWQTQGNKYHHRSHTIRQKRIKLQFLGLICLICTLLFLLFVFKFFHYHFPIYDQHQHQDQQQYEDDDQNTVNNPFPFTYRPFAPLKNSLFKIHDEKTNNDNYLNRPSSTVAFQNVQKPLKIKKCQVTIVLILCNDRHSKSPNQTHLITNLKGENGTKASSSKTENNEAVTQSSASTSSSASSSPPSSSSSVQPKARPNSSGKLARNFNRQLNQTIVLLKSIAIQQKFTGDFNASDYRNNENGSRGQFAGFSGAEEKACANVLVLSDEQESFARVRKTIFEDQRWASDFTNLVNLTFVPVTYPPGSQWMKKLFRPCATLRLFLADLLPDHDSVIYLDTDIILLDTLTNLWAEFDKFHGKDTIAAMAPCLNHYGSRDNQVPYYGRTGLNAGIMLMNLTRMRTMQWTKRIQMVTSAFQRQIKLADQDILNIYFHSKPDEMHPLTCDWNFRPFQCRPGSFCQDLQLSQGISALHGNALSFTTLGHEPLFYAVFSTFQNLNMTNSSPTIILNLFNTLQSRIQKLQQRTRPRHLSDCTRFGAFSVLLLSRLQRIVDRIEKTSGLLLHWQYPVSNHRQ